MRCPIHFNVQFLDVLKIHKCSIKNQHSWLKKQELCFGIVFGSKMSSKNEILVCRETVILAFDAHVRFVCS